MKGCSGTTVLMYLSQFLSEYLYDLDADFDSVYSKTYPGTVWMAFQDKLGRVPRTAGYGQKRKRRQETEISAAWNEVNAVHTLCPNHFLNLSEEKADEPDDSKYKVDASFIHNKDRHAAVAGKPNWPYIRFLVVFKRGGIACDPFDDAFGHDPDAVAQSRIAARGQLMSYTERLFAYQHRTAVYMLFVNEETFRVMRWDRSGVIVTEAVNYIRTIRGTKLLLRVAYAFSKLSLEQQGIDLTATMLLPASCGYQRMDLLAEAQPGDVDYHEQIFDSASALHRYFTEPEFAATFGRLAKDGRALLHSDPLCQCSRSHRSAPPAIPVLSFIWTLFRQSLVSGFPRYVIKVDGHDYLVGKPIFSGSGMVGRGTRGYVALEWETQRFVFLKDSWRPFYDGLELEGDVLSALNEQNVPGVPTVVRYDDVHYTTGDCSEQETETSHYSTVTGAKRPDYTRYQMFAPNPAEQAILDAWLESDEGESEDRLPRNIYENVYATWQPGDVPDASEPEFDPFADPQPASMPELKAGPIKKAIELKPSPSRGAEGGSRPADKARNEPERKQGYSLRHLVHTRMVVVEVCLPMTEFTSSYQLTNIIFECIRAHARAYERCNYMHRDVSAGNILILPVIRCKKSVWSVYWQGILADWEFAKHYDRNTASRPQRTGTWHFMSVFLSDNAGSPSTIADELESFLHVLVYGAVRRVSSNLVVIDGMLNSYFSGGIFDAVRGEVSCPAAKHISVAVRAALHSSHESAVVFSNPDGTIAERHALNLLIAQLLRIFHARYVVLDYERSTSTLEPHTSALPITQNPETIYEYPNDLDDEELEDTPAPTWIAPAAVPRPSQEVFDAAKSLSKHETILKIFIEYLKPLKNCWPRGDVVLDRLYGASAQDKPPQADTVAVFQSADASPSAPALASETNTNETGLPVDPAFAVDHPAARPSKRRRKDPVVQPDPDAVPGPGLQPVAGTSAGRLTRSRSAASADAAQLAGLNTNSTAEAQRTTTTRVTRSKSGALSTRA